MQKIEIPEGCNALIDYENRVIVIEPKEVKPKFKKGDTVYAVSKYKGESDWIIIFDRVDQGMIFHFAAYCEDYFESGESLNLGNISDYNLIKATPDVEDSLSRRMIKEGIYWDAEALEVKYFMEVPESIGIYKPKLQFNAFGDGLFIGFNENKQVLGCSDGLYTVDIIDDCFNKVQCYLQPCKREDLKSGDTAFFSPTFRLAEDITSDLGRYVKIVGKANYKTNKSGEIIQERNHAEWWYKLIPINS